MNKWVKLVGFLVLTAALAACGGGGGGQGDGAGATTGTGGTVGSGAGTTVVNVAGNYTGTYKTNIIVSNLPYSLSLQQNGSSLTGQFNSRAITGTVTGTVAADKSMALTITEPAGVGTVNVALTPSGNSWVVSSVTGTDAFGIHTSGSGTVTANNTPLTSVFANGYNGYGTFANQSNLSGQIIGTASGTYPISISNLLPDGSGTGWSGTFSNLFVSGIIGISYVNGASLYTGVIYPAPGSYPWAVGNGGFQVSEMLTNMYFSRVEPNSMTTYVDTVSTSLHNGDIAKTLPGTWTYTNPDPNVAGIASMSITVTTNGWNYTGQVTASIRQTANDPTTDTVTGTITGVYNLAPYTNPHIGSKRVFQMKWANSGGTPLTITNPSGLTSDLIVYVNYVENSTTPMRFVVNVDSGNKSWPDITLTR